MTLSMQTPRAGTRTGAPAPRQRRRIVDEYPVGYLAELTRPLSSGDDGGEQRASRRDAGPPPTDPGRSSRGPGPLVILPRMDADHARELLSRERARVERSLAGIAPHDSADLNDPFEAADAGSDLLEDEIGGAVEHDLRERLAAIERAERRIEDGTYGLSVDSGEPIPDERLEAIPWAERTAAEQARLDT